MINYRVINMKKGVNIRKKPKKNETLIPITSWENMVNKATTFKKNPPLYFVYQTNGGDEVIFRLVISNEEYFVYAIEYSLNGISQFDYLYYWRKESTFQKLLNDRMNIKREMRWADTFTATRSKSYGSTYSHIEEMLQNLGVDIEETF